ncbi:DMT family transporter [Flagellimonas meridianipacifica]|uniref:Glucose uptake protein GlcU n=1 Tax=Flagellimonas meridianipacifica TaxID=1080225 RepID=A0A2T0MAH1_9FLAO|nr:DMT family transporter [Allomuricauda pacifica]PRX54493.1 glucose uptake protein GlcU [Allomuricauda pacifica]
MLALILSVLCSTLILVIFKLYATYGVQTLYAIIVNYITACSAGLLFYTGSVTVGDILEKPWVWGTVALGVFFILVFNIIAKTSQVAGVSVASVATKMSLVIPVIFGVFLYKEELSMIQIIGILLALAAVYFSSVKESSRQISKKVLLLPLLAFLGSGLIDAFIKYFEEIHLTDEELPIFSAVVFGAAALTGLVFIGINAFKKPLKINTKNVLGGITLGIPNYFSIFFLVKALQHEKFTSAAIFTINNVAIVMLSTLVGVWFFKESMSFKNWGGIVLAVLSIVLVALF